MEEEDGSSNRRLAGKTALVTGASRGIGAAIAVRLAMAGANVALSARSLDDGDSKLPGTLRDTAAIVERAGGRAMMVRADLAHADDRERMVQAVEGEMGGIDILVNNAAVTFFMPVSQFTEKRFKLMMEVQVYAPFHLAQLVLPGMKAKGGGAIVNISSPAGIHPSQPFRPAIGSTVYGMCKVALERFTSGLAAEVQVDGIGVHVVSPGLVDTPGVAVHGLINDATRDRVQPIEYISEAVYQLAIADPQHRTGRIDYAEALLDALSVKPRPLPM